MGFFATFSAWLDNLLSTYIGTNTAQIAALLAPAILTLATVYVMIWGYLLLMGQIEEPFVTGVKRIILLVVILSAVHSISGSTTISSSTPSSRRRPSSPPASSAPTTRSGSSTRSSSRAAMPRASSSRRAGSSTGISPTTSRGSPCT